MDSVEEMQDISTQLDVSFHRILRDANALVDSLAREGVFAL